jgi:hypothetical protein
MRVLMRSILMLVFGASAAFAQGTGDAAAKVQEILKQARAAIGDESKLSSLKGISIAGVIAPCHGWTAI